MFFYLMLVFTLIAILPEVVIWPCYAMRLPMAWRILYAATTLWVAFSLWVMHTWPFGHVRSLRFFFLTLIFLIMPKMVFVILAPVVGWGWALAVCLIAILCFTYGLIWGWRRLSVREVTCSSPLLPEAFDGYRILQISDLHVGTLASHPEVVSRVVEMGNAQNADLIVFTGDLVNHEVGEAEPFVEVLAGLRAPDGVLAILGNHDYVDHRHFDHLLALERRMGWRTLVDEHVTLHRGDDSIHVIGVGHICSDPELTYGDLEKAAEGLPEHSFRILLSHNPAHWHLPGLRDSDIPLTLSGHTHGAQLCVFGWSPARLMYKEWGGAYHKGQRMLYVSLGISGTVPFRLGAWPEINVITLRRSSPKPATGSPRQG